jgi:hypothetical protein
MRVGLNVMSNKGCRERLPCLLAVVGWIVGCCVRVDVVQCRVCTGSNN